MRFAEKDNVNVYSVSLADFESEAKKASGAANGVASGGKNHVSKSPRSPATQVGEGGGNLIQIIFVREIMKSFSYLKGMKIPKGHLHLDRMLQVYQRPPHHLALAQRRKRRMSTSPW